MSVWDEVLSENASDQAAASQAHTNWNFDLPAATGELRNGAGIQPWSSPEQYVLFAIDDPTGLVSNGFIAGGTFRWAWFEGWLEDQAIGFKKLAGCYKGKVETAYIINARDWRKLAESGWIDGQESVLHLGQWSNGGRPATLYYAEGKRPALPGDDRHVRAGDTIGTFSLTTKQHALACDAWTFDPSTGEYFVAE